ncbi:TonB-dependent receptor [candidate division KSB1 bacterium]|nr:TonB-dependent receptor [candidate division KSB1 bacterium]
MIKRNQVRYKQLFVSMMLIIILSFPYLVIAQTTGKIAGQVTDAADGTPLVGANVMLEGTRLGAAAGMDGHFFIINIPPGSYTVKILMMGYNPYIINNVRVSVNRTFEINAKLQQSVIEGEEVVVIATAIETRKDQTSSVRNVSSEKIESLPVESIGEVVNLQAGVVRGHFRGGRDTEVTYLIDGIQVDETFQGDRKSVDIEADAVEDLEVLTGTFNAEYGRAMSGVVNVVTKEGGNQIGGSASVNYANFLSSHDNIFMGLDISDVTLNLSQDYKFQLEGPIFKNQLTFFMNGRYQKINGHLNGIRRFTALDYNDHTSEDSTQWHIEHTGNNEYVSMIHSDELSFMGKLMFRPISPLKLTLMYTLNDEKEQGYSHYYKYNPDARQTDYHVAHMLAFTVNHMLNPSLFYELKVSLINNIYESYAFENPIDSRYLHPRYHGLGYTGFSTGGSPEAGKNKNSFEDGNVKFDINWQLNRNHSLKSGVHYINHRIKRHRDDVRNIYYNTPLENISVTDQMTGKITWPFYDLELLPITDKTIDVYQVKPYEYGLYIQDKMEFDNMVINVGLRYDYFDPKQVYPTNRRNPDNVLILPDSMKSTYPMAPAQTQLSPRLGLAYQLGKAAVLHFSYGHFFQMPPMYSLYANNIFRVPLSDYGTTMGNTLLNAQKTITYEIGLWQELTTGMGLEVALYYRDIYDLLSTQIISTYNQIEYGLYTNKDYGNARGLEVKWNYEHRGLFTDLNYTLAYTKGNADNPQQTFTRAGSSMDPIKRLIPMSWDQRHTINVSVGYQKDAYGFTLTGYYNSGIPYTYQPLRESSLYNVNLYTNNDYQPSGYTTDLAMHYSFQLMGKYKARFTMNIYNLLDRLNTVWVYSDTGQPYTTVVREGNLATHHSDFNDYYDRIKNPSAYSAPRQIKIGLGIVF